MTHEFFDGSEIPYGELRDYLLKNFGEKEWHTRSGQRGVMEEFVKKWHERSRQNAEFSDADIELVFTRIETELFRSPRKDARLERARYWITERIVRRLRQACEGNYSLDYMKLCQLLKPGDVIVTFNWDDLIEKALDWRSQEWYHESIVAVSQHPAWTGTWDGARVLRLDNFQKGPFPLKHALLLKLHGSVTWFACPTTDCPEHNQVYMIQKLSRSKDPVTGQEVSGDQVPEPYYEDEGLLSLYCNTCGKQMVRVIVPPITFKPYEDYPAVRVSWWLAYRALQHADRIVAIGYSFRESDAYSEWLLASAVRNRPPEKEPPLIKLVCPSNPPLMRVKDIVRDWSEVSAIKKPFSDWVDDQFEHRQVENDATDDNG